MILNDPAGFSPLPLRIISLVPSQTELMAYLGLDKETVGITKFCVHPKEWFEHKERIGGTKKLDLHKIRSLEPTLIIANKEENNAADIYALANDFSVWVTDVKNLQDAMQMIRDIGTLTHRTIQAKELVEKIGEQFLSIQDMMAGKVRRPAAYLVWKDPYMVAGGDTFINNMMHYAGFENVFSAELRYPEVAIGDIVERNPDVLLLPSEPYPFKEKHLAELGAMFPGTKLLLVDGEMFSWYGSRLLKATGYFRSHAINNK